MGPGAGAGVGGGTSWLPYTTLLISSGPLAAETLYSALSDSLYNVEARFWAARYARGGNAMLTFMTRRGEAAGDTGADSAGVKEASGVGVGVVVGE